MDAISKIVTRLSKFLDLIGGYFYFALMILVVLNILGRTLFTKPIPGTIEFVEIFTAVGVGLTIAYCALQDEHITVDFIFEYFPKTLKKVISIFVNILVLGFLGVSAWMIFQYGISVQEAGRVTPTVGIPYYPFLYIIAIGFFMYFLVALIKIINIYRNKEEVKQ